MNQIEQERENSGQLMKKINTGRELYKDAPQRNAIVQSCERI